MALKPSSYVILGLVRGGITSGYAIRRFVEQQRMELFWATTFAQIYPELALLEDGGYVTHHDDPQGARPRRVYALTPKGERALMAWLRRSRVPAAEVRDEGLLRLAFADHLPPEDALELVARLRENAERLEREFREAVIPGGEALGEYGVRFAAEVGRIGLAYHTAMAEQLARLEAALAREQSD